MSEKKKPKRPRPVIEEEDREAVPCHLRDRGDCDCEPQRCLARNVLGQRLVHPD